MKGDNTTCAYSGCSKEFTKRRNNHQYCCDSHRAMARRERKGIPEPDFMVKSRQKTAERKQQTPTPSPVPTLPTVAQINAVQLRGMDRELAKLSSDKQYWIQRMNEAQRGVFPIGTLIGVGGGYFWAADDKKEGLDLGAALFGGLLGLIGNGIDNQRKINKENRAQAEVLLCQRQIKEIDREIRRLKRADKVGAQMKKEGLLDFDKGSNIFTVPPTLADEMTAADYKNQNIPKIGFDAQWKYLIGDPAHGFYMLVSGLPGNGKSTFAVKFATYLQQFGKVLYIPSEQPKINAPFQALLKRLNANFTINHIPVKTLPELDKKMAENKFIVIDSVNHMRLKTEDIETLREKYPKTSIIAIMQSTKQGKIKGSQEFAHNCDIEIRMEDLKAVVTKNRYAEKTDILLDNL